MDMQNRSIAEMKQLTIKALPALEEITNTSTLWEYFAKKVSPVLGIKEKSAENTLLSGIICDEIERLYGQETAQKAAKQMKRLPVIETGTHLAFMRDHDNLNKDSLRSHLHQNVLISSALMKKIGANIHIGSYASNVSLNSSCSGGYFQLGDEIFPVTTNKNVASFMLYNAPRMTEDFFNDNLLHIAKFSALRDVLREEEDSVNKTSALKTLDVLLAPIDANKINYKGFENSFNKMNPDKKEALNVAMASFDETLKAKKGYGFNDIDAQFDDLKEIFGREDLSFSDQVALVQSKEINAITKDAGIEHISLDSMEITKKFLIESLKDENSFWFNVFNDKETFEKFHSSFVGIRSSWGSEESVFDNLRNEKGFFKSRSLHKDALSYKPAEIIELLERNQMMPSNGLMVLVYQSADMLIHGGFFQSTYAKKMKTAFEGFLQETGFDKKAETVAKIPADMMLLSLASVTKDGVPAKLSEISRMTAEDKNGIIDTLPSNSSMITVQKGLELVTKYLDKIAPGYIEHEAKNNTKQVFDIKDMMVNKVINEQLVGVAGGR